MITNTSIAHCDTRRFLEQKHWKVRTMQNVIWYWAVPHPLCMFFQSVWNTEPYRWVTNTALCFQLLVLSRHDAISKLLVLFFSPLSAGAPGIRTTHYCTTYSIASIPPLSKAVFSTGTEARAVQCESYHVADRSTYLPLSRLPLKGLATSSLVAGGTLQSEGPDDYSPLRPSAALPSWRTSHYFLRCGHLYPLRPSPSLAKPPPPPTPLSLWEASNRASPTCPTLPLPLSHHEQTNLRLPRDRGYSTMRAQGSSACAAQPSGEKPTAPSSSKRQSPLATLPTSSCDTTSWSGWWTLWRSSACSQPPCMPQSAMWTGSCRAAPFGRARGSWLPRLVS